MAINTPPYGDSKDYPRNNRSAKVVFFSIIKCDWTPARPLFYIYLTFAGRFMTCGGASGVAPSMLRWLPGMLPRPWCKSPAAAWPDCSDVNKHYLHDGCRAHPGNALWHKHLNRHAGMPCNTGHTDAPNGPYGSAKRAVSERHLAGTARPASSCKQTRRSALATEVGGHLAPPLRFPLYYGRCIGVGGQPMLCPGYDIK